VTEPFIVPFKILVDAQEKHPYRFGGMVADADLKGRSLIIETEWKSLKTGDYSISGWDKHVTIERKSLEDLYSTLGQHRDRFEREHQRMAGLGVGNSCVVIEANWERILKHPPRRSRLCPKTVFRTFLSWSQKYCVPWYAMESRRFAEVTTFRWLEKWWYSMQEVLAEKSKTCKRCGKPLRDARSIARGAGHVCSKYGGNGEQERNKNRGVPNRIDLTQQV
jgi:hypothetical protein